MRKATRARLAKSELLMTLAATAERWSQEVGDMSTTRPFAEWNDDPKDPDPMHDLLRRYDLSPPDLVRLLHEIGAELERRSMRAGYEDALI